MWSNYIKENCRFCTCASLSTNTLTKSKMHAECLWKLNGGYFLCAPLESRHVVSTPQQPHATPCVWRILFSSAQQLLTLSDLFPGVSDREAPSLRYVRLQSFLQEGFCPLGVPLPPEPHKHTQKGIRNKAGMNNMCVISKRNQFQSKDRGQLAAGDNMWCKCPGAAVTQPW